MRARLTRADDMAAAFTPKDTAAYALCFVAWRDEGEGELEGSALEAALARASVPLHTLSELCPDLGVVTKELAADNESVATALCRALTEAHSPRQKLWRQFAKFFETWLTKSGEVAAKVDKMPPCDADLCAFRQPLLPCTPRAWF